MINNQKLNILGNRIKIRKYEYIMAASKQERCENLSKVDNRPIHAPR